jgi:uncharacterized membrane protein
MARDGAPARGVWVAVLLAALVVVVPQVLAPLALPAGSVRVPVPASPGEPATWPYAFGAAVCHQRPDRSFALDGNQLPVCERCFAIELGMVAAFGAAVLVRPPAGFVPALGAFLPRRLRTPLAVLAVGLALMLPMALDGGLQLVTAYVSGTPLRVATGLLYGIGQAGVAIGLVAVLAARLSRVRRRP